MRSALISAIAAGSLLVSTTAAAATQADSVAVRSAAEVEEGDQLAGGLMIIGLIAVVAVIAIFVLARRWTAPMAALGFLIFLLSISLGWHYAADGIVGAAFALGCYALCLRIYDGRLKLPSRGRPDFGVPAQPDPALD